MTDVEIDNELKNYLIPLILAANTVENAATLADEFVALINMTMYESSSRVISMLSEKTGIDIAAILESDGVASTDKQQLH